MEKKFKLIYAVIAIMFFIVMVIGSTYAYWAATAVSANNALHTESTIYSISMEIRPIYYDFSFIPMNDTDALKALNNKCRDKYDRGACSAYQIRVYDYNPDLSYISGFMDVTTDNMENLSYMMLRLSDTFDERTCVQLEGENYCIVKEATAVAEGKNLSLGDAYDVTGMVDTKFILLIWLTNLSVNQNDFDIGNFNAILTMQAGNGGEIKGSIASVIKVDTEEEGG